MDLDNDDFVRFVVAADHSQLEYVLIGGMALILNGGIGYTEDADLWLEPSNENRHRFIKALCAFGCDEADVQGMSNTDFTQPQMIRIHDIPMDVLTSVPLRR